MGIHRPFSHSSSSVGPRQYSWFLSQTPTMKHAIPYPVILYIIAVLMVLYFIVVLQILLYVTGKTNAPSSRRFCANWEDNLAETM